MAAPTEPEARRAPRPKLDAVTAAAVDLAREAVLASSGTHAVGDHLGVVAEGDRVVTHLFACTHPGYRGWRWNVTLARAARAKVPTVDEVALLPGEDALLAPAWVPWSERVAPDDLTPGLLMPTPIDDERLEPGFTGGDHAADRDPAEASQLRAVVAELGLGRERLLSPYGREETADRWLAGDGGPDNQMSTLAPGPCVSCGYFIRLQDSLGTIFGVCANEVSPSDGRVVAVDHGCGAHSDVADEAHTADRSAPIWDTISMSEGSLFD